MARDGRLPFARQLSYVSKGHSIPLVPGLIVSLLSIGVLLVNLGNTQVFAAVSSVAVVIVYLAYLMVTVPLLMIDVAWPRMAVYDPPPGHPHWYLQYLSLLLVGVALVLGALAYPLMKRQQGSSTGVVARDAPSAALARADPAPA